MHPHSVTQTWRPTAPNLGPARQRESIYVSPALHLAERLILFLASIARKRELLCCRVNVNGIGLYSSSLWLVWGSWNIFSSCVRHPTASNLGHTRWTMQDLSRGVFGTESHPIFGEVITMCQSESFGGIFFHDLKQPLARGFSGLLEYFFLFHSLSRCVVLGCLFHFFGCPFLYFPRTIPGTLFGQVAFLPVEPSVRTLEGADQGDRSGQF